MQHKNPDREKTLGTLAPTDVPLQQLPVVELSAEQIERAKKLAEDRNDSYDAVDGGSVFGTNDSLRSHLIGIIGELAIAILYATNVDAETYSFGDGGSDFELWGLNIDVKATATTKMQLPQLLICQDNPLTADLYILTHIIEWGPGGAQVRVLGYASRDQVSERTPRQHPGSAKNYVIDPDELTLPPVVQACDD